MPSFHLTIPVHAPAERVWRALCDPSEVVQWDVTVVEAIDAPPDYPKPGQHVRWRIAGSQELLHDRPLQVEPPTRLRSLLSLGHDRMDEVYTLRPEGDDTILDCNVALSNDVPVIGALVARLRSLPSTRRAFATSLTNLKRHCESMP